MQLSDAISFGSLFATILTGIAIPFIERPMLGYEEVSRSIDSTGKIADYTLKIQNMGFVKLTNVIGTLNLATSNISSSPELPNSMLSTDLNISGTFFKLSVLPPQSSVSVKLTNISNIQTTSPMSHYVASEEWVGYPTWYIFLVNMIATLVAGIMIFESIRLLRKY